MKMQNYDIGQMRAIYVKFFYNTFTHDFALNTRHEIKY